MQSVMERGRVALAAELFERFPAKMDALPPTVHVLLEIYRGDDVFEELAEAFRAAMLGRRADEFPILVRMEESMESLRGPHDLENLLGDPHPVVELEVEMISEAGSSQPESSRGSTSAESARDTSA